MVREARPPRRAQPQRGIADYKRLYRKLETTIDQIEQVKDPSRVLSLCLRSLVDHFQHDLGFVGGRLYEREGDHYVLRMRYGRSRNAPIGYQIPVSYPPIQILMRDGLLIMRRNDPGFDETIEGAIGVSKFAAFSVDDANRHIISMTISGPIDEEHTLYALNGVRHIINMRLRQQELHDIIHEARDIQLSMLPTASPEFAGYDIAGASVPADIVGGDLFDYILYSSRVLGVAVTDSSGHGLPAALQARDVITGLRMGMAEDLKIIATIEKLNRVIHRSTLTSRFVSLFYGEIEANGNFIYCNAGHPPALLLHEGAITELKHGGMVLGPTSTTRFERGFARLEPGDCILMYTDGITEAEGPGDKEFGVSRLRATLKENNSKPAAQQVAAVFDKVNEFTGNKPQSDDRTVVIIRRL